ncbi:ABC transporter substrate-binding protein [Streptomyces sp. NPDC004752]
MSTYFRRRRMLIASVALTGMMLSGCGLLGVDDKDTESDGKVTITLAGPNQWTSSGSSFGPAWEALVKKFEKREPNIRVKTQVLPLDNFGQTISTWLNTGSAPEMVFNQAPHKAQQVHALNEELNRPNPYIPGNKHWIDSFREEYYSPDGVAVSKESGELEYVPFNLSTIGLYYNKEAFQKAGVKAPLQTWEDFRSACTKLRKAGYDPVALDSSQLATNWTWITISAMLNDKYYDNMNVYNSAGQPGKSKTVSFPSKAWAKAIKEGTFRTTEPEVAETLKLTKEFFDCGTKNWSGISDQGSSTVVGLKDFATSKAAIAWGTDFAPASIRSAGKVDFGTMPFPTITKETTPLSSGAPARWGASVGGTSYMIPSTVKGKKYDATIKFLQFVSSPEVKDWLHATGGLPAIDNVEAPSETAGLQQGSWAESYRIMLPMDADNTKPRDVFDGYLLGRRSLKSQLAELQRWWERDADTAIKKNGWSSEPWAK